MRFGARRLLRYGDGELDAYRVRGARDVVAGRRARTCESERMFQFAEIPGTVSSRWCGKIFCRATSSQRCLRQRCDGSSRCPGSINCIKHLQATAIEARCEVDMCGLFDRFGKSIPVLSAVRPIGETSIEEFERAGGAAALLKSDQSRRHLRRWRRNGSPARSSDRRTASRSSC